MKAIKISRYFYLMAVTILASTFVACEKDEDDPIIETRIVEKDPTRYAATIHFNEVANDIEVELNSPNKPYINAKGQAFNITRLRYLVSDITFHKADGNSFTIDEYHLVDISQAETQTFTPETKVPAGEYTSVSFTFGFDEEDNQSSIYPDLNIENWSWPGEGAMMGNLGGGYHFMQLEGQYDSAGVSKGFATHMGTARNNTVSPTTYEANHFTKRLDSSSITISGDFEFTLEMQVEQWYENPYEWDFNTYNLSIMPIYDAQRKLNLNGPSVFRFKK
ncbi:MAG: hypothetical protein CMC96_07030 [Flavobacteriales bacterium]|nr:hypothetical protein [Flavobacteriales bacterium]|tara:strand:- start:22520 stop:23350 length:831 start_codon:yes stop_codon:yes gene_type:complete